MRININHPELFATVFQSVTGEKLYRPITGICTDSRLIKNGDLFIAIRGSKADGHSFLNQIESKGALAALVRKVDKNCKIQQIKTSDTINELAKISTQWRNRFDIPIVGITGSNGKTSTKELLVHILSGKFKVHATEGNHNTKLGLSLTLLKLEPHHEISILEMGASIPNEIDNLCKIARPTHGLITNISTAHLEGFGSLENIAHEKGALFRHLTDGISFVNMADKMVSKIPFSGQKITFGLSPDCDFPADICHDDDGTLTLVLETNIIPTNSFNLSFLKNCIASSAISITLGVDWNELKEKLQSFSAPNGRCNVKQINNITVIDDTYNANLASSLAALDYLYAFSGKGRKIFVFGDMLELGDSAKKQHQQVGKKCSELGLDGVFTLGIHTKHTNSTIGNGMIKRHYKTRDNLIQDLRNHIVSGDKILFKGSRGMQMESIIHGVFEN